MNKCISIWIQTSMMKIPIRALVLYKNAWHHALRAPETYISLQSLIKTVPPSQKDLPQKKIHLVGLQVNVSTSTFIQ